MRLNLRALLLNNSFLKISSCIIGFILWSILNESYRTHLSLGVPVCFYNVPEAGSLTAPEATQVTLSGKPSEIRKLSPENVAVQLDAQKLSEGKQSVPFTAQNLLLPPDVQLVKYKPIQVTYQTTQNDPNN
jgi:hypothetical protein